MIVSSVNGRSSKLTHPGRIIEHYYLKKAATEKVGFTSGMVMRLSRVLR
jgi:hypothetical protein